MAENCETLENILPDWANEEIEITLVEAVDKFQKEEEEKTRFYVENDLEKILEQSQSLAIDKTKHKMGRKIISRQQTIFLLRI